MRRVRFIISIIFMLFALSACTFSEKKDADIQYSFDGSKAYELLSAQATLGDRSPGSKNAKECIDLIKTNLTPYCDKVYKEKFIANVNGQKIPMTNIIGIINPKAENWIMLSSHWDNRPFSDKEKDAAKQENYCPGANDGASSTAVLLELARVLSRQKPDVGVMLVFFDGEDYGKGEDNMYFGSKYFSSNISNHARYAGDIKNIKYGILLDMIGDSDLNIYVEQNSNVFAPKIVDNIWNAAAKLGYKKIFIPDVKYAISDDHIPLNNAGIPTVDIIDFDYKYWHTNADTPDKCSEKSLKIVGDVITKVIYNEGK